MMVHYCQKMNLFAFRILLLSVSIAGFSQIGNVFSSNNLAAYAQAVPLVPIQTGNATLDKGIPMFYDCIEEAVDESFSEQEPNYFHEEPTKTEVNSCYTDVFVTTSKGLESIKEVDYGNDKDEKAVTKEDQNHEVTKIQDEDTNEKLEEAPENFIVIPGSW
jgi:hypothetical protein